MKYLLLVLLIFVSCASKSQPVPDCFRATKRLFIKSNENLLGDLVSYGAAPSELDSTVRCLRIHEYLIKDSLGYTLFDFKIYNTIKDYSERKDSSHEIDYMHIYVYGLELKDSLHKYQRDTFNYYLEIPKFMKGEYWIHVSDKSKILLERSRGFGDIFNITPKKWRKGRKMPFRRQTGLSKYKVARDEQGWHAFYKY